MSIGDDTNIGYSLNGDVLSMEVISLTGKRDEDIAAELKAELRPHIEAAAAVMNKASSHGMQICFQLARDQYGRNFIQTIDVVKPL